MPPQAVTLEPLVQGECVVIVLGFSDEPSMLTNHGAPHSCGMKYRLRGLARLRTSQRNFVFTVTLP